MSAILVISENTAEAKGRTIGRSNLQNGRLCKLCRYPHTPLAFVFLLLLASCQNSPEIPQTITIKDYRVFYDGQNEGFNTIYGSFVNVEDELKGVFIGGTYGDLTTGKRPFLISSKDTGKIWSEPVLFGEQLLVNPEKWEKEALRLAIFGPTQDGTIICFGDQFIEGENGSGALKDPQWRAHTLNIGRKASVSSDWTYTRYPSETFLGEQFVAGGNQLPGGRIIFTIWGAKKKARIGGVAFLSVMTTELHGNTGMSPTKTIWEFVTKRMWLPDLMSKVSF